MSLRLIALYLIVLSLAACGGAPAEENLTSTEPTPQTVAFDQALYDRGVEVYLESYCGTCHQLDAAGTRGNFGPAHNSAEQLEARINHPNYSGSAETVEAYLRESILQPDVYVVPTYEGSPHRMPAYTHLEDGDIDALVYLLLYHD